MPDREKSAPGEGAVDGAGSGGERAGEVLEVDEFGLPMKKYTIKPDSEDGESGVELSNGTEQQTSIEKGEGHDERNDSGSLEADKPTERVEKAPVAAAEEPQQGIEPVKGESGPPGSVGEPISGDADATPTIVQEPSQGGLETKMSALSTDDKQHRREESATMGADHGNTGRAAFSEWSHQRHVSQGDLEDEDDDDEEGVWQEMPAFAPYDIYDDDGKLIAREAQEMDDEAVAYSNLGGAGKGYTKVNIDEDAQSATSMDENTKYLFKESGTNVADEDDPRDALSQMQATKDLLTEGQRVAYVGLTRVHMVGMTKQLEDLERDAKNTKEINVALEATKMWAQKMMVRLYAHMDINPSEQIMIEQLAEHGVQPSDLAPSLMLNCRVKNPMAERISDDIPTSSPIPSSDTADSESRESLDSPPPPYSESQAKDAPEIQDPSQLPSSKSLDIDLRWTVLCDLFLILIADSVYDARSRTLLERVGDSLGVSWLEICKFEKRVTDALEMQEAASKENWNEDDHMENRRKLAFKRKIMMMGLATVGGSLVIGLSAGLLAPVIGAGLAAGFTTIGVAGTGSFLAGAGGAAIVTTTGVLSGAGIALKASHRRTEAVKTFEYRPLYNNKRTNLIVTVSGWMTGKVDDVRLPYTTIDPIMGDIYSVLWEPEMLRSMGETINILATEALTQGLQQVLGSTILITLMAGLQLPIVLTKLAYLIDNPWTVSLDRANAAGLILADSLIDRNLGVRPITLVGFSLGARVIFSCLRELAKRGAYGLVQNVYLFGSPVVAKRDEYIRARAVISGRFVNGYATNDWILGYLFRATSGGVMRVSGLAPVEGVPGLENIDVTDLVKGHMAYRAAMPRLLREVGWMVESDEFAEIEDPDPENHERRQRELITEIEAARRELDKKPDKKKFGFFSRKKIAEKKGWETYQESSEKDKDGFSTAGGDVLFDVDAIRAELASEQIEVKQLESTLPPMKLDSTPNGSYFSAVSPIPRPLFRDGKSPDPRREGRSSSGASPSLPSLSLPDNPSSVSLSRSTTSDKPHTGYNYEGVDNDGMQMTFDTAYSSPKPSTPRSGSVDARASSSIPERPTLQHAATVPNPLGIALDHNAWADEDEEFGREKEVEMTFE